MDGKGRWVDNVYIEVDILWREHFGIEMSPAALGVQQDNSYEKRPILGRLQGAPTTVFTH